MSRDFQAWVPKESQIRRLKSGFGTRRIGQVKEQGVLGGAVGREVAFELANKVERGEGRRHGGAIVTAAISPHVVTR